MLELMKRICNFILLLCLVQLAVAQNRIAEIRENLLGNHPDKILVVSHRADWRNAPENSLQGIQNCIDMGVDMVEIDLKRTNDLQKNQIKDLKTELRKTETEFKVFQNKVRHPFRTILKRIFR